MTGSELNSGDVKALTKRRQSNGELYTRRPEVELQISKILSLESKQIFELLDIRDRNREDYVFDETIVYLLRQARERNDDTVIQTLYIELNRRIWNLLNRFRSKFSNVEDFEDLGQTIGLDMLRKIFDTVGGSADYAQVNFGDFVITQGTVKFRENVAKMKREENSIELDKHDEDGQDFELETNDLPIIEKLSLQQGFNTLPPHILEVAVMLRDGWQIESKNESEPTISKHLKVSSRTIRNWLNEARRILAEYEGEGR